MSETDKNSAPFARGNIVWGRPPQQVFRVGPLPRSQGPAPGTQPADRQQAMRAQPNREPNPVTQNRGGSILGGSLVPQRPQRPVSPLVQPSEPKPTEPKNKGAQLAEPRPDPVGAVPKATQARPVPVVDSRPSKDDYVVPVPPLSSVAPLPVASEVKGSEDIFAPLAARAQDGSKKSSYVVPVLLGGVLVLGGTGAFIFLRGDRADAPAIEAASQVSIPSPHTASADVVAPVQDLVLPETTADMAEPRVTRPVPPSVTAARPQPRPIARVTEPAKRAVAEPAPATVTAPVPQVVMASEPVLPPSSAEATQAPAQQAGPAPTAARPTPTDPNAPIVTRPQPLDPDPSL